MIIKFFKRDHRGGLKESLATKKYISQKDFNNLLNTNLYEFYAYDERVYQYLFILKDIENNYKKYTVYIGIEAVNIKSLFDSENIIL